MKTKQQIFDEVKLHLLTQNKKSENVTIGCVYRTTEGLKCAIGCLIPDELYQSDIEGVSPTADVNAQPLETHQRKLKLLKEILLQSGIDVNAYQSFLRALQDIHDMSDVKDWEIELKNFAKLNDLES